MAGRYAATGSRNRRREGARFQHSTTNDQFSHKKVWNSVSAEDSFSDSAATDLAAELNERVADAEATWDSLDHELLKWFGGEGIAAAGAVITGHAGLVPAALGFAGAGAVNVIYSAVKRHSFTKHHPAAFFIGRN
ncbi:MAG: hypothetical protein AABO58_05400 [Acidobacteriota bacterium]